MSLNHGPPMFSLKRPFPTPSVLPFQRSMATPITKTDSGTVRIAGVGNLQNSTLTLNPATGSWIIENGTLRNGTLNLTEGATLRSTSSRFLPNSALEQMTINGDIIWGWRTR